MQKRNKLFSCSYAHHKQFTRPGMNLFGPCFEGTVSENIDFCGNCVHPQSTLNDRSVKLWREGKKQPIFLQNFSVSWAYIFSIVTYSGHWSNNRSYQYFDLPVSRSLLFVFNYSSNGFTHVFNLGRRMKHMIFFEMGKHHHKSIFHQRFVTMRKRVEAYPICKHWLLQHSMCLHITIMRKSKFKILLSKVRQASPTFEQPIVWCCWQPVWILVTETKTWQNASRCLPLFNSNQSVRWGRYMF